jgi:hypothetical protein
MSLKKTFLLLCFIVLAAVFTIFFSFLVSQEGSPPLKPGAPQGGFLASIPVAPIVLLPVAVLTLLLVLYAGFLGKGKQRTL